MTLPPGLRKLVLTVHVTTTLGWLGAVAVFLALALIGLTTPNAATARGAYLVMEPAARFVLVPLALASLLTGVVQGLGTRWGLFRHYWVVFKLLITVLATVLLLVYLETFSHMATVAANPAADLDAVRNASPVIHAVLALAALLVATVLAVFKPRGVTRYGWRRQPRHSPTLAVATLLALTACAPGATSGPPPPRLLTSTSTSDLRAGENRGRGAVHLRVPPRLREGGPVSEAGR